MCGIAGIVGEADVALLRRMLEVLRHRGPDDLGTFVDGGVAIGQSRLSIIDVAGGHQPILDEGGRACVVANGEIYNYRELAKGLAGHRFRTKSDSEVPLHLYEDAGPGMAGLLDGMFALAIWDGANLYLARDPIGIKPLYYAVRGGTFYFASEAKALLEVAPEGIREFPPGHWYRTDLGFHAYADWDAAGPEGAPDLEYALRASEYLGTVHHIREYTEDEVLDRLPDVIWHLESFDAALVRSAVPTDFVSELARRHVTVVLTGEGADELYAGYRYLKALGPHELDAELLRMTKGLHNLNLQRTDRMTMAHAIEGRVPYLDWAHIRFALRLPPEWKLNGAERMGKWILRRAFEGILPGDLLDRPKRKFAEGAGSSDVIRREAERQVTDSDLERLREEARPVELTTKEEAYCYRLFKERFPKEFAVSCVGRTAAY